MKVRKKPVEVEAFQMTILARYNCYEWPVWIQNAWSEDEGGEGKIWPDPNVPKNTTFETPDDLCIGTKEGVMRCPIGWWIIRGIKGELYCCEPDIFEATYEKVE